MLCCNAVRYDVHVRTYSGKLLLHSSRSARWLLRLSMRHLVTGTSHLKHHHYLPTYLPLPSFFHPLSAFLFSSLFFSFLRFSCLLFEVFSVFFPFLLSLSLIRFSHQLQYPTFLFYTYLNHLITNSLVSHLPLLSYS